LTSTGGIARAAGGGTVARSGLGLVDTFA